MSTMAASRRGAAAAGATIAASSALAQSAVSALPPRPSAAATVLPAGSSSGYRDGMSLGAGSGIGGGSSGLTSRLSAHRLHDTTNTAIGTGSTGTAGAGSAGVTTGAPASSIPQARGGGDAKLLVASFASRTGPDDTHASASARSGAAPPASPSGSRSMESGGSGSGGASSSSTGLSSLTSLLTLGPGLTGDQAPLTRQPPSSSRSAQSDAQHTGTVAAPASARHGHNTMSMEDEQPEHWQDSEYRYVGPLAADGIGTARVSYHADQPELTGATQTGSISDFGGDAAADGLGDTSGLLDEHEASGSSQSAESTLLPPPPVHRVVHDQSR